MKKRIKDMQPGEVGTFCFAQPIDLGDAVECLRVGQNVVQLLNLSTGCTDIWPKDNTNLVDVVPRVALKIQRHPHRNLDDWL